MPGTWWVVVGRDRGLAALAGAWDGGGMVVGNSCVL